MRISPERHEGHGAFEATLSKLGCELSFFVTSSWHSWAVPFFYPLSNQGKTLSADTGSTNRWAAQNTTGQFADWSQFNGVKNCRSINGDQS